MAKKKLFIYHISQDVNDDYDTFDSAIVAAESEEDAKTIHPSDFESQRTWCAISDVKVKLIGVANKEIERGVICASFNAG